ncbi:UNVERIFIED_CONTAM: putative protein phosphatase 2C 8 [Sesamum latifolium]|uniref:PPM-type phosphatase domain-containing protein n=1 Tax=Sesamum latifolium TaxID=2727402 RepID=A0AAW2X0M7_9LAMI
MMDSGKPNVLPTGDTAKRCRRRLEVPLVRRPLSLSPEADSKLDDEIHSGTEAWPGDLASERGGALNYGFVSIMGRRRVMENAVTVVPPWRLAGKYSCFGVYDGHGGAMAAETCGERLHKCLERHIERTKKLPVERDFEWRKVMVDCLGGADHEEFWHEVEDRKGSSAAAVHRFTALVVVVGKEEVVVVNFGNSKAVLCRGGLAVPLSSDLKGERADEKVRADGEAVEGRTISWNVCSLSPLSTTSRSLGGEYRKQYIIKEPEVTVTKRTEQPDDFLIIATNSLWNVVGDKTACEVVKRYCVNGESRRLVSSEGSSTAAAASEAAAALAVLAIAKGSKHNISIIVVQLK